jgi:hypothetical protein
MRPIEHAADPMERTCSVHSNFRSDPIGHGHGHGHGKTEPVQGHTLAARRLFERAFEPQAVAEGPRATAKENGDGES